MAKSKKQMIEDSMVLLKKVNDLIELNDLPLEKYDMKREMERLKNMPGQSIPTYQEMLLRKINELKFFLSDSKEDVSRMIKSRERILKNKNI